MKKPRRGLYTFSLIFLLSILLVLISLGFANGKFDLNIFLSYIKSPKLLILNFLPIFLCFLIAYGLLNSLSLGYLLITIIIMLGGIANKTKIIYRNYPVVMMDISLLKEARLMSESYKIPIGLGTIILLVGLALIFIGLRKYEGDKFQSQKARWTCLISSLLIFLVLFNSLYKNVDIYNSVGSYDYLSPWIESESYQGKGFVYPFIYSYKNIVEKKPENYSEEAAKSVLNQYQYQGMQEGKKPHIIGIMLEAYNDFSKFENLDIDESVYKDFHSIKNEGVHGSLVTNVFAGGTVDTERGFLTGYQNPPKFNRPRNSFVRYFQEEGYRTVAMHPITGGFYNRENVNKYLGFDEFYNGDNYYGEEARSDEEFLRTIIEDFEENKDQPYFNFSVTYQNHGPYDNGKLIGEEYLKLQGNYSPSDYNIINNYLLGIKDTGENLRKFVDYFKEVEEPVIIVLFGDHNPWLGEKNSVYKALGIDLNLEGEAGFKNYYETPYIILGNASAKESLSVDLAGEREEISPMYLMAQVFEEMGIGGNPYLEYLKDMKKILPVQNQDYFKENGSYSKTIVENQKEYREFINTEFYYSRRKAD